MKQSFETGIKEVIQLHDENYFKTSKGNDIHTLGYPLGLNTPGGGFIYEMKDNRVSIGFLTGLCYENPMLDLYDEFIRFKQHPFVANIIKGGKVIEQGARTVSTGGYFTIPQLAVDGGMFIGGCTAMQNVPGLKGIHVSMKSGMLAAEAAVSAIEKGNFTRKSLGYYQILFENSWLKNEVYEGRNFSSALAKKIPLKFIYLGAQYFTEGKGIRDEMFIQEDYKELKPLKSSEPQPESRNQQSFDGQLYVDKLTGIYLSKTMHREDQPSHIIVHDQNLCINECFHNFKNPCTRFCPGNVYEIETDEKTSERRLKLNSANCLHCKTCDIKDPYQNITWRCPEGGRGHQAIQSCKIRRIFSMRIGTGYDVHCLVSGRKLVLGGITIPFEKGLLGHSDADVLIHSICDALLGAAGLGDIGLHFPDTDTQFKDINSMILLARTSEMIRNRGFSIINIDSTIFAEKPKISPYRKEMQEKIAKTLEVSPDCINVKATTTEGLGMFGKGEGIGAMSIALIDKINEIY